MARKLSDIRFQYTIADKSMDVLRTFAAIHKDNAMKNKKVSMDVIASVMDSLGNDIFEGLSA